MYVAVSFVWRPSSSIALTELLKKYMFKPSEMFVMPRR